MLLRFCQWLEHVSWITAISNSVISSVLVELAHYFGFFLLVGAIATVDFRLLGIAGRREGIDQLAKQLFPLMWTGMALAFLSGFVMLAGQATLFVFNPVFHIKLLVIFFAVIFGLVVQSKVPGWAQLPAVPIAAKCFALISLLLWIGAILAAVEIPHLTYVP
jgi:hypothetical protein